jgi:hypothetical protein
MSYVYLVNQVVYPILKKLSENESDINKKILCSLKARFQVAKTIRENKIYSVDENIVIYLLKELKIAIIPDPHKFGNEFEYDPETLEYVRVKY